MLLLRNKDQDQFAPDFRNTPLQAKEGT